MLENPLALAITDLERLRDSLRGPVIDPDDEGYDAARAIWNGAIDRRPACVARCTGVADVVAALIAAQESDDAGPINVGTGVETSVLQLAELVGGASGRDDFEPEFAPARGGEIERTALDTAGAAERLGWRAERTIEAGIEQTIEAGA